MPSKQKESILERIAKYDALLNKFEKKIQSLSNQECDSFVNNYVKVISKENLYSNDHFNTNNNGFTNDKRCNNVLYIGNSSNSNSANSNNMSRGTNSVNGISYGPSIF